MKMVPCLSISLIVLLAGYCSAEIWYVEPDSTGAVINIQAGIDSCGPGDTVLVSSGLYRGNGNRNLDFKGKPIVVISECRYDATVTDSTIIDCEGSYLNRRRGFYFHSGETYLSILDGFVITNGYYSRYCGEDCFTYSRGGGIACDSLSSPTIRYNRILNCTSGIYCSGSSAPLISNNIIYQSGSYEGGGIFCRDSSAPIIRNNIIYENHAGMYGGGIFCKSSSPVIAYNRIHKNSTSEYGSGGGISCYSCTSAVISNNEVYNNFASSGSGISIYKGTATIRNNEIWDNDALGAGAIEIQSATANIVGNSVYENKVQCASIWCYYSSSATIDSNYIYKNGHYGDTNSPTFGIRILHNYALIRHNDISYNPGGGIWCVGVTFFL